MLLGSNLFFKPLINAKIQFLLHFVGSGSPTFFCKISHKPFQCLDVSQHAMTDPLECTAAMGRFLRVGDLFLSATYPELLVIFPCRLLLQYTLQIKNSCKTRGRYKASPEGG